MHKLGERCELFQKGGQATDPTIDKRMDFHFNAILDVVSEWRKDKSQSQDTPLGGAITQTYYLIICYDYIEEAHEKHSEEQLIKRVVKHLLNQFQLF